MTWMRCACRWALPLAVALLSLAVLAPRTILAQVVSGPVANVERFELDPSGQGSLATGGGRLLPPGSSRLALGFQYEPNPAQIALPGGIVGTNIYDRFTTYLEAGIGISRYFEIGAELPVILYQTGTTLAGGSSSAMSSTTGVLQPMARTPGLVDPLLSARISLLSSLRRDWFDLAVRANVMIPANSQALLGNTGTAGASITPGLEASRSFGPVLISLSASAQLRADYPQTSGSYLPSPARSPGSVEFGGAADLQGAVGLDGFAWHPEIILRGAIPFAGQIPGGLEALLAAHHALFTSAFEVFGLCAVAMNELSASSPLAYRGMVGVAWTAIPMDPSAAGQGGSR